MNYINIYTTNDFKKTMKDEEDDKPLNPNFMNTNLQMNQHFGIFGGTGSGKSNFLVNYLLATPECFKKVYIFTNSSEKCYNYLKKKLKENLEIYYYSSDLSKLNFDEIKKEPYEKLIVFDDFIGLNKSVIDEIKKFATVGRKHKMTLHFLSQDYTSLDKVIRKNLSYIVLCRLADKTNLKMIITKLNVNVSLPSLTIEKIINNALSVKMNVCLIDLTPQPINLIFRRNIYDFYQFEGLQPLLFTGGGIVNH